MLTDPALHFVVLQSSSSRDPVLADWQLSCGAHKVGHQIGEAGYRVRCVNALCQGCGRCVASRQGWARLACLPPPAEQVLSAEMPGLVAVTDDVDACVLSSSWGSPQDGGAVLPSVRHTSTIPALAYITTGKQQRKHLLIGWWSGFSRFL